jgi:hypothetical protein
MAVRVMSAQLRQDRLNLRQAVGEQDSVVSVQT